MVCILEIIWVILKTVRGLFITMFIWEEGLFRNILKRRVLFANMLKGGRVFEYIEEGPGGYGQNALSSSSPVLGNRGGGRRLSAAPNPAAMGFGGGPG